MLRVFKLCFAFTDSSCWGKGLHVISGFASPWPRLARNYDGYVQVYWTAEWPLQDSRDAFADQERYGDACGYAPRSGLVEEGLEVQLKADAGVSEAVKLTSGLQRPPLHGLLSMARRSDIRERISLYHM